MKTLHQNLLLAAFLFTSTLAFGQLGTASSDAPSSTSATGETIAPAKGKQKVVIITGVRFTYPLVQKWIDDYNQTNPDVQIIIESRGSADPAKYDILIEAYQKEEEETREHIYLGRYAVLPVANNKSEFAEIYGAKGLNKDLIKQLFFHDLYADKEDEQEIKAPYTIYTRLQKAGAPVSFTKYFGFEQKDIKGKAIAGSDEHLLKAVLRDSTAVSYLPLSLIYDGNTNAPIEGLTVLPVDLSGNGKVQDDEKFYGDLTKVLQKLEEKPAKDLSNVPVEYIYFSVDKTKASPETINFLKWVVENGQKYLHGFGYLQPEANRYTAKDFEQFASKRFN
jgi:ABC-type phosphate transport system substrate-binding protein